MNRGGFRGGGGFARPENALKRAEELENVGQKNNALQVLHDIITSKKHRTWSKTYEQIMFKHIDLVVEMKKRNYGKEALMQYRNMCQAVNINSLEEVIKYYLKKASDKAEEAQKASAAVTIDVADLEEDVAPEDIMLSYVSADKSKDRTDREMVTPWFRFLWEAYRSVLEILRTNPKLEPVYAMTANKAFQFCLQFKRPTEFRRLCDILRQHLTNLTNRYRDNRESNPDQLQLHLETRFEQLRVACELEMWAEAFRSVEDIQALILLAKKNPKQQLMATYYARLTQIFAVSENHLYHAYAWLKLFNFSKAYNKHMTPQDFQTMSSSVLLAMLSILPYDNKQHQAQDENAADQEKERILRMANILGFQVDATKDYRTVLSRAALLNSVGALNVLALVPPEIRQIFELLTSDFNPLELCSRMSPLLDKLSESQAAMSTASPVKEISLGMYANQLKQVTVLRLLKQLSEVYSSMRVSTLASLVPFMPFSEVEAVVVDAVKCDYLQVRIDHRHGTLHFGAQQLESDRVRTHLQLLSQRLGKVATMIEAPSSQEAKAKKEAAIKLAIEQLPTLHSKAVARKALIEKRKEEAEQALIEAEREEERRRIQATREAEQAESRRRQEEAARREKERIERELEEAELAEAKATLEALAQKKKAGAKGAAAAGLKLGEGEKLDKRAIMLEAQTERFKEAQELERKMVKMARQMDHLERARREEEAPALAAALAARQAEEKSLFEALTQREATKHRAQWEDDIANKKRLAITLDDRANFQAQIIARRQEEFESLRRQREKRMQERKAQRRAERQVERRRRFIAQCQEQVNRRVQEIEEEEAAKEAALKKQEEEERQRKLREIAEAQRRREQEIEERLRAERASAPPPAAAAAAPSGGKFVPSARRALGAATEDRDREAPRGGDDRWGGRRDDGPPAARGAEDGDRWGGSRREDGPRGGFAAPAARSGGYAPPFARGGDRPEESRPAPAAAAAPAPAASDRPAPAPGKFVPPHLRNRQ